MLTLYFGSSGARDKVSNYLFQRGEHCAKEHKAGTKVDRSCANYLCEIDLIYIGADSITLRLIHICT